METTARGFRVFARVPTDGGEVRVQESSDVTPHVWIFQNHDGVHLCPEAARKVAESLLSWANSKEAPDAR